MTNPGNKAYEAVVGRMSNAAAIICGAVWVPVQLIQPEKGVFSWGYLIAGALAAACTILGLCTALDPRPMGGFWATLKFAFGQDKKRTQGFEDEQRIDSFETSEERQVRNRGTLQLSLITCFLFAATVVAAAVTAAVDVDEPVAAAERGVAADTAAWPSRSR